MMHRKKKKNSVTSNRLILGQQLLSGKHDPVSERVKQTAVNNVSECRRRADRQKSFQAYFWFSSMTIFLYMCREYKILSLASLKCHEVLIFMFFLPMEYFIAFLFSLG